MSAISFHFDEARHAYIRTPDGMILPSCTQILKACGYIDFSMVRPAVLERKRQIGTLVHRVTELWDKGEDIRDFEIPLLILEYAEGYFNFCVDTGFRPWSVEERAIGNICNMLFGMTPDRVGALKGEDTVLELKCGASESPAWGLQLAGYDLGRNGRPALKRAALQLGPQFSRGYKLHPYEEPIDYQLFQGALAQTIWMQNKGLFRLEPVPEREAA